MSLRISNLRLGVEESELALPDRLAGLLDLPREEIRRWRILRKSLDGRDKHNLGYVYTLEVELGEPAHVLGRRAGLPAGLIVEPFAAAPFEMPPAGSAPLRDPPVVVGSGPAGLAAAYFLAERGYRPLVLERGKPVRDRIRDVHAFDAGGPLDPESNYLFGEGGAGTFSDGKLTCRSTGPDVQRILQLFADCKGKPSVVYDHRPHLGSNRLPAVVKALRQRIERMGGSFRFQCRVEDLVLQDGEVRGVATSGGVVPCSLVVLAVGHSARDTYAMLLRRGVPLAFKPFQMGVRIEQPQEQVNRRQYGSSRLEDRLGAADYNLRVHGPLDVFSFCMCAGGVIIPSVSEPGHFCTNGMSLSKRDSPYANSGLVVTLGKEHVGSGHPLAGVELQRRFEARAFALGRGEYRCPLQRAEDFLSRKKSRVCPPCSYPRATTPADISEVIPEAIAEALRATLPVIDRRWRGRFLAQAVLAGPEARGSSPVRIVRDAATRQSPGIVGLYPAGEGAGYAGGIISAAVDGLRTAKAIIAAYAPLERR